jgi:hypothetical protein
MGASARHDHVANRCLTTKAGFSVALVNAMPQLKFTAIPFGIHIIRDRRAPGTNGFGQDFLDFAVQTQQLLLRQIRGDARGMKAGAKEAFVRVNVANASQNRLIEKQSLEPCPPPSKRFTKFIRGDLERFPPELSREFRQIGMCDHQHAAKTADIRVTQFAPVTEGKKSVGVRQHRWAAGVTVKRPVIPR